MASQLQFGRQPTNTAKSATITPAVTARILDRFGNLTTSTTSVTIAIDNNPPSLLGLTAGTLNGTMTPSAVAGVATFNDLRIDGGALNLGGTGNGYTLKVNQLGTDARSATRSTSPRPDGRPARLRGHERPSRAARRRPTRGKGRHLGAPEPARNTPFFP